MSIDFATIKGLEIPEGIVTKIVDASGLILWNAVKMANLTITSFWDGMDGDSARITITSPSPFAPNPNEPSNKVTSWTAYVSELFDQPNRTIKIPVGSTIECYITRDKGNADSYIKLNGVNVATGEGTYIYTVTGDATIDVSEDYVQGDFGVISIVGAVTYISFSINGTTYQAIEGMSWKAWFASSYNTTGKAKGDVNNIKDANGNEVSLDSVIISTMVYEVEFVEKATITLDFTSAGMAGSSSVKVNGTLYKGGYGGGHNGKVYEIDVAVGDKIVCMTSSSVYTCKIVVNGTTVSEVKGDATYEYTVIGNATIIFNSTTLTITET